MAARHFLAIHDLDEAEIKRVVARGIELKQWRHNGYRPRIFDRRILAMIFEKSSTRTRVSFEAALAEGGGKAIFLSNSESQVGRGEPPEDTARVLSQMSDAIMIRTFGHDIAESLAAAASVPVINGLTNELHPCQVLTDLMTYSEHRGAIRGRRVAWIGDGNNMCNSYVNASRLMGFELRVACPPGYAPSVTDSPRLEFFDSASAAATGADVVVTDVWASMGQEAEADERLEVFKPYQVNRDVMAMAASDALFFHCLPAHRGEEVTAEVIDHADSVVWDEAGNRLHAQKALLEFLLQESSA